MEVIWESPWLLPIVSIVVILLGVALTYFTIFMHKVKNKLNESTKTDEEKNALSTLIDEATAAMAEIEDEFVRQAKAAAADGKLTKEEVEKATQMLKDKLLARLKGPALEIAKSWGLSKFSALAKSILAKWAKK